MRGRPALDAPARGGAPSRACCTDFYLGRYLLWNLAKAGDWKHYPSRCIRNAGPAFQFRESDAERERFLRLVPAVSYRAKGMTFTAGLGQFLRETNTTAFLVIQNDTLLYEGYFSGYRRDSINSSFSVAKSVASILIGIAIDEGSIGSVEDPITAYLPELKDPRYSRITIRHLLAMCSGLRHRFPLLPWSEVPRSYLSPDLRRLALHQQVREEPGRHFHYNNCHTQLLGTILERTTGRTVSGYLEQKVWRPLGMEYPASWSLDSAKSGFELMAAGLNARSIDFAKLGRLLLRQGDWEGRRIVSAQWLARSTAEDLVARRWPGYFSGRHPDPGLRFLASGAGYYGWHWWGYRRPDGTGDVMATGLLGQFIYVSPAKDLVIVRNGLNEGGLDWYPAVLKQIADRL
jgi:CubicO group peptidase (beta-lactamase class C family)